MRELLYPIFLKCCAFTPSDFWHEIFEDLAYGKTPNEVYISNGYLCCKKSGREFSYRIPAVPVQLTPSLTPMGSRFLQELPSSDTPPIQPNNPPRVELTDLEVFARKVYQDVSAHLIRLKPIYENDRNQKKIEAYILLKQQEFRKSTWDSIRKKSTKDRLIEEYVLAFRLQHNLTFGVARAVLALLMIALIFKMVVNEDIQYEDFSIHSVRGLDFGAKGPFFSRMVYGMKKTPSELVERRSMSECWKRFRKNGGLALELNDAD